MEVSAVTAEQSLFSRPRRLVLEKLQFQKIDQFWKFFRPTEKTDFTDELLVLD